MSMIFGRIKKSRSMTTTVSTLDPEASSTEASSFFLGLSRIPDYHKRVYMISTIFNTTSRTKRM